MIKSTEPAVHDPSLILQQLHILSIEEFLLNLQYSGDGGGWLMGTVHEYRSVGIENDPAAVLILS